MTYHPRQPKPKALYVQAGIGYKPREKKPRKPARKSTPKRAKERREYSKRRKTYLATHPYCLAAGPHFLPDGRTVRFCKLPQGHKATQIHHMHGEKGPLLNWEPGFLPVCPEAHDNIHSRMMAEAKAVGAIRTPWNTMPKKNAKLKKT